MYKTSHQAEIEFHAQKVKDLTNKRKVVNLNLIRLVDMKLDSGSSITENMFARKRTEIEKEIANLKTNVAMHDIADEKFKTLVVTVFSDITLTGKKLSYSLRCPFDLMVENASCETWLPLGTTLRTERYGDVIQYGQKLKLMKVDLRELQLVA